MEKRLINQQVQIQSREPAQPSDRRYGPPQPAVFVERCASVAENTRTDMDEEHNWKHRTVRPVLALWMNLQRPCSSGGTMKPGRNVLMPWDCQDARVCNAWDALTHPRNEVALEIPPINCRRAAVRDGAESVAGKSESDSVEYPDMNV